MEISSNSPSSSPASHGDAFEDWDDIPEELPDSLAPYIKFASSKENSNKLVVNATLDNGCQRVLHGEAAAETFFGWTVQWLLLPHRQEVENFKIVLKAKYGEKIANFAFPKTAEQEALSVGLQGGMIREAILKALYQKILSQLQPIIQKHTDNLAACTESLENTLSVLEKEDAPTHDFLTSANKHLIQINKRSLQECTDLTKLSNDLEKTILDWLSLNGDENTEPEVMNYRSVGLAALTLVTTTIDLTVTTQSSVAWFRRALWVARMLRG